MPKIRKAIDDEMYARMKSETADAEKFEVFLTGSLEKLRTKFSKLANNFVKFHVILTPSQRAEIV